MKFRHAREYSSNTWSGHRFILTLTNVEHRLYVWWKKKSTIYPLPFEYQRRVVLNRPARSGRNPDGSVWMEYYEPYQWPKRRKHKPNGWAPRVKDSL